MNRTLTGPVFLCGAPRSGTTLLSNLLDWNDRFLVYPNETHILQLHNSFGPGDAIRYFSRDYLYHHDVRIHTDPVYRHAINDHLSDSYGSHAVLKDPDCDAAAFREAYLARMRPRATDGSIPIEGVYSAFTAALLAAYPSLRERYGGQASFIEKRPLDNEMSAGDLRRAFPNARFVHILRDPRTRYLSSKTRNIGRAGFCPKLCGWDFPTAHSLICAVSFACAKLNRELLKDDYLVVRYEDLVSDRRGVMERVTEFLGIPLSETVLRQTRFGLPVESASSFKERVSDPGVLGSRRDAFLDSTSALERHILNYYCGDLAREFGYDLPKADALPWGERWRLLLPVKNEAPWHYFGNRLRYFQDLRQRPQMLTAARIEEVLRGWYLGKALTD